MPVTELRNWLVTCDTCGQIMDVQDNEGVRTKTEAKVWLRDCGWIITRARNLCPQCIADPTRMEAVRG